MELFHGKNIYYIEEVSKLTYATVNIEFIYVNDHTQKNSYEPKICR